MANWFPNLEGKADPNVALAVRRAFEAVYGVQAKLNTVVDSKPVTQSQLSVAFSPANLQSMLQSTGPAALNVTNLTGQLMTNQYAFVPKYTSAPKLSDKSANVGDGTLISISNDPTSHSAGVLYRFDQRLEAYFPQGAIAVTLEDTHANRVANYDAEDYEPGTLFWETDRTVLYLAAGLVWQYALGIMYDLIANRPTDLTADDVGFLFYASDQNTTYRWDGTVWIAQGEIGILLADTHANRLINYLPADFPIGAMFFETDRTVVYRNDGTDWIYVDGTMKAVFADEPIDLGVPDAGFIFYATDQFIAYYWTGTVWMGYGALGITYRDTHANRAGYTPADFPIGVLYNESDRFSLYRNDGTDWVLVVAWMYDIAANRPADLGLPDNGFQFYASDTTTLQYWDGTDWIAIGTLGVILTGTLADQALFLPADYPIGSQYYATDIQALYYNSGTAWLFMVGFHAGLFADLPVLGATDAGYQYYETDTGVFEYWDGTTWQGITAGGGGGAPATATYITQVPDAGLSAEQALSLLATGVLMSTTATGVVSIATFPDLPGPGAWDAYTPTTSNLSSVTASGAYSQFGKTCNFRAYVQGTSNGSNPTITLPFAPVTSNQSFSAGVTTGGITATGVCRLSGSTMTVWIGVNFPYTNLLVYEIEINGTYETV
jgi:hypothetical protein